MKKTPKQIFALIGVALLLTIPVVALIIAVFFPGQSQLLGALFSAMIGVPILIWLMMYVVGKVKEAKEK